MSAKKKNARIAGLLYLVMAIIGGFGILYIPAQIVVSGNAVDTVNNILDNEFLFRLAIASQLISGILFIFLALALYRILENVNPTHAKIMVIMVLIAVPVGFAITIPLIGALHLVSGLDIPAVFETEQIYGLVLSLLISHQFGILVVGIFWGLWLFPFGYLVYKSGFIPRIFGVLLMIGCGAYLIDTFGWLMFPEIRDVILPYLMLPLAAGEFSIIAWLVFFGVKIKAVNNTLHI